MAYTRTWDASYEATPADTDNVSEGAQRIRNARTDIRERMEKDHYMDIVGTDADHGEHKKVTLREQSADPTAAVDKGFVYTKESDLKTELFYLDEDGNAVQITCKGAVKPYIKVSHVEAYNVSGGDSAGGTWKVRVINTEDSDDSNLCSVDSINNQITLEAGTYTCSISCPVYAAGRNQAMLYNVTDSAVTLMGTSEHIDITMTLVTRTFIVGKFTISAQKTFEIRHRCTSTVSSGFGIPHNFSGYDNVYTIAEFWRE